ncbi:GNAT family N-acetyltransferase [Aurantibacillus circumpalustris]|uniref:GNAT family N-acetyltransferase n=1 Tax=Aurantibacillus circumpalustris TaxID=3036359 RepID=UPI00295B1C53|nr:GNAT family N-acetyltransferase [Aurantibacillus circumpalustris]
MEKITLVEYKPDYQDGINHMMLGIEKEFPIPITSPQSTRISEVYQLTDQKFWVALFDRKVVGTVGLQLYSNGNAVVKRMMVDKEFRGSSHSTATLLLNKSVEWGRGQGVKQIFLGTMDQFIAAQKFYLKKGFIEIKISDLPSDYSSNPIDSLYYRIDL